MQDDYLETFETRGDRYNEANLIQPCARLAERQALIDLLCVDRQHIICDAPAGGGSLADGLRSLVENPQQIICIDPSPAFAHAIDTAYTTHVAPVEAMPIGDDAVNRVGSLAGLHHLADKSCFFREAHRVLATSGRFVLADVLDNTPGAEFLNGLVDRYSVTGHRGLFVSEGECSDLLDAAGFNDIEETYRDVHWRFSSETEMVEYCALLFGLEGVSTEALLVILSSLFDIRRLDGEVHLPWALVYAVGEK